MNVLNIDQLSRLKREYEQHGSLFVAFDYDNTVHDYHQAGLDCADVIKLLRACNQLGFKLILFTANEGAALAKAKAHVLDELQITVTYVNENPEVSSGTRKPYYNILLDDRAGLAEAYHTLRSLVDEITEGSERRNES